MQAYGFSVDWISRLRGIQSGASMLEDILTPKDETYRLTEARLVKSTGYEKYPEEPTTKRPDADAKTPHMGNCAWNMSPGFCTGFFPSPA